MLTVLLCTWIHGSGMDSRLCAPHLATMHFMHKVVLPGSVQAVQSRHACLVYKAQCQPGCKLQMLPLCAMLLTSTA